MSAIGEYLRLIPTALRNKDLVIEGIVNKVKSTFGVLPEDEQKEIARRMFICQGCPFNSSNAVANPAINYKSKRPDEHCIHCGCPLETKTASLGSRCGIEIFNINNPGNELPLKWDVYKKTEKNGNNSEERQTEDSN